MPRLSLGTAQTVPESPAKITRGLNASWNQLEDGGGFGGVRSPAGVLKGKLSIPIGEEGGSSGKACSTPVVRRAGIKTTRSGTSLSVSPGISSNGNNISIASGLEAPSASGDDRVRKSPRKTTSFTLPSISSTTRQFAGSLLGGGGGGGSSPGLPDRAPEAVKEAAKQAEASLKPSALRGGKQRARSCFVASERGSSKKKELLPTTKSPSPQQASTAKTPLRGNRARARSGSNIMSNWASSSSDETLLPLTEAPQRHTSVPETPQSLRSRRKTISAAKSMDDVTKTGLMRGRRKSSMDISDHGIRQFSADDVDDYSSGGDRRHSTQQQQNGYRSYQSSSSSLTWKDSSSFGAGASGDPSKSKDDKNFYSPYTDTMSKHGRNHKGHRQYGKTPPPWWWKMVGGRAHPSQELKIFMLKSTVGWKIGHILQMMLVATFFWLVYDSYEKALTTTVQLVKFKQDESMLMLHMKRLESHSLQIHKQMSKLTEQTLLGGSADNGQDGSSAYDVGGANGAAADGTAVDLNLIRKQTQQLEDMERELNGQVQELESRIQKTARASIVHEFGEGPVQVVLDIGFPDYIKPPSGGRSLTLQLWYDTPHAAWVWLEQIQARVWDRTAWHLGAPEINSIDSGDGNKDNSKADAAAATTIGASANPEALQKIKDTVSFGRLQYVEQSNKAHDAWTVGLVEDPALRKSNGGNGLRMFINLADNQEIHKHLVCVGKVIDGFNVLQRLVEVQQQIETEAKKGGNEKWAPITIQLSTASHLKRKH